MILSKTIKVNLTNRNMSYYENKGYTIEKICNPKGKYVLKPNQTIEVKVEDLPCGSKNMVDVQCDYCGDIAPRTYKDYLYQLASNGKDACRKCTKKKEHDIHGDSIDLKRVKTRVQGLGTDLHSIKTLIESKGYKVINEIPSTYDRNFEYEIYCNKHNTIFTRKVETITKSKEVICRSCLIEKIKINGNFTLLKTHEHFIQEMNDIHPNIKVVGEYINSKTHIECECKTCKHNWRPTPNDLLSKEVGCPRCNCKTNKEENKLYDYLFSFYGEKVERQVKYKGLIGVGGKPLSYDFRIVINDTIYLIERQGEFHDKAITFSSISHDEAQDRLRVQQEHDRRKKEFAKENDYKLIEIWYYDDYKHILKENGLCEPDQ